MCVYGEMYIAHTVLLDPSEQCQIQIWEFKTKLKLLAYMYFQTTNSSLCGHSP